MKILDKFFIGKILNKFFIGKIFGKSSGNFCLNVDRDDDAGEVVTLVRTCRAEMKTEC
jgi:hypothetical protein